MSGAAITVEEREILAEVFAPFAEKIESIRVFGSRATGLARPNSDIDLVIFGDLDSKAERRLWTELDETSLSVSVDLVVYSRIKNDLLKQHIDDVSVPLFSRSELERARKGAQS